MSHRRVFANNNNLNFNDYNRCIKGQQIYKDISNRGPNYRDKEFYIVDNELTKFLDYDTFLNLTKTFYRYNGSHQDSYYAPSSIDEGKKSFLYYKQLLSHIKDCDYCCQCKNILQVCECKEAKNYLYPYGNFHEEKQIFKFPTRLNVACQEDCSFENREYYREEPKKLVPICSEPSYKPCCNKSSCEIPLVKKGCYSKCYRPYQKQEEPCCCKPEPTPCINNVYPSQSQFKIYKEDCNGVLNDCDKEKRMNAYAIYPQINRFACFDNNKCAPVIKPVPCDPCRNTCCNPKPLYSNVKPVPPPYGRCCR
jgi:hypothetical protein